MFGLARKIAENLIVRFGYDLHVIGTPPRGYVNFLESLKYTGFYPKTVFDVGVGHGTPWLYEAFPDSYFVLIEPQRVFEPSLRLISERLNCEYHLVGAGAKECSLPIYDLQAGATGSSFLPPTDYAKATWGNFTESEQQLPVVPLDHFAEQNAPYLIKIDTEGFELEVLKGANKILEQTEMLLLEVSILGRQVGEADLIDIGMYLKEKGFRLFDIPCLTQQGQRGPLIYVDAAFTRVGGQIDRYAASGQRNNVGLSQRR